MNRCRTTRLLLPPLLLLPLPSSPPLSFPLPKVSFNSSSIHLSILPSFLAIDHHPVPSSRRRRCSSMMTVLLLLLWPTAVIRSSVVLCSLRCIGLKERERKKKVFRRLLFGSCAHDTRFLASHPLCTTAYHHRHKTCHSLHHPTTPRHNRNY